MASFDRVLTESMRHATAGITLPDRVLDKARESARRRVRDHCFDTRRQTPGFRAPAIGAAVGLPTDRRKARRTRPLATELCCITRPRRPWAEQQDRN